MRIVHRSLRNDGRQRASNGLGNVRRHKGKYFRIGERRVPGLSASPLQPFGLFLHDPTDSRGLTLTPPELKDSYGIMHLSETCQLESF